MFWQTLPKPFFALAPMEQVTDTVFRQIVASCARPDVFFTEFTSAGGLAQGNIERVERKLEFCSSETPLIAQIWGNNPDHFFKAAQYIADKGFAGIDINMGCPDKGVVQHGAGSGLIRTPELVPELIKAIRLGAPGVAVSIKTRIGFSTIETERWISYLLSLSLDALTIHGRTRKEMSKVPAHWDEIGKAVAIRDAMQIPTVIIGNGDIKSREEGIEKSKEYGVDGIMIGRGIFSNIWIFEQTSQIREKEVYINKLLEHTDLFEHTWGITKDFNILKKFYKVYVRDFPDSGNLRMKLMEAQDGNEVHQIIASQSW